MHVGEECNAMRMMSNLFRVTLCAALMALSGVFLGANQARADWYAKFVRFTCVPEANYAAIETLGAYNVRSQSTLAAQGIVELATLQNNPLLCKLQRGDLSVELVNYHTPQPTGVCGAVEDGDLRVTLAGKELTIATSTHGGCTGSQRHDIRLTEYDMQHCVMYFDEGTQVVVAHDPTPVKTTCKNVPLP